MAQFVAKIVGANGKERGSFRTDSLGRDYLNLQDQDTGQYLTVYGKKGKNLDLHSLEPGSLVVFFGTLHPFVGKNVKMVCRSFEVVK